MNHPRTILTTLLLALLGAALFPAMAAAIGPQHALALPTDQIWAFVAGNLAPLAGYLLTRYGTRLPELAKGFIHLLIAAIAGGIAQAITAGNVGLNNTTLQFVVTAIVGSLLAHHWFWQPTGTNATLQGRTAPRGVRR